MPKALRGRRRPIVGKPVRLSYGSEATDSGVRLVVDGVDYSRDVTGMRPPTLSRDRIDVTLRGDFEQTILGPVRCGALLVTFAKLSERKRRILERVVARTKPVPVAVGFSGVYGWWRFQARLSEITFDAPFSKVEIQPAGAVTMRRRRA